MRFLVCSSPLSAVRCSSSQSTPKVIFFWVFKVFLTKEKSSTAIGEFGGLFDKNSSCATQLKSKKRGSKTMATDGTCSSF